MPFQISPQVISHFTLKGFENLLIRHLISVPPSHFTSHRVTILILDEQILGIFSCVLPNVLVVFA